jgi:hypothetical protein
MSETSTAVKLHLAFYDRMVVVSAIAAAAVTLTAAVVSGYAFSAVSTPTAELETASKTLVVARQSERQADHALVPALDALEAAEDEMNTHLFNLASGRTRVNDISHSARLGAAKQQALTTQAEASRASSARSLAEVDVIGAENRVQAAVSAAWIVAAVVALVAVLAWIAVVALAFNRSRARVRLSESNG